MPQSWRATLTAAALYLVVGANLPYLPVWMEEARGLSGTEISGAAALATILRVVIGPLSAVWAARIGLKRTYLALSIGLLAMYGLLLPDAPLAAIFVVAAAAYTLWGALMPLSEALLIAATRDGRLDYGLARAFGSTAFIVASLTLGALIRSLGPEIVVYWLVGGALLMLAVASALEEETAANARQTRLVDIFRGGLSLYKDRRILCAGFATAFIQSSHAYYYNLGSNVWISQGIEETHIGALWSVGVVVEVALLALSARLFRAWTPGALILLGGVGAIARWTMTGFLPPLEALYAIQGLHAMTFAATHLGMIRFIAEEVPEDQAPFVVSVNSALAFGPMMALGGLASGFHYDMTADLGAVGQAMGYWLMAGLAGLGAVVALALLRRRQPQSAALGGATRPSA